MVNNSHSNKLPWEQTTEAVHFWLGGNQRVTLICGFKKCVHFIKSDLIINSQLWIVHVEVRSVFLFAERTHVYVI